MTKLPRSIGKARGVSVDKRPIDWLHKPYMSRIHPSQSHPRTTLPMATTPSIPLKLDGFVAGNTIHLEGEAGIIHFSARLDISQRKHAIAAGACFDGEVSPETVGCCESRWFSHPRPFSSHEGCDPNTTVKSPPSTPPLDTNTDQSCFPDLDRTDGDDAPENFQSFGGGGGQESDEAVVRTRLRSGAISPVAYFPRAERARVVESCVRARGNSRRPRRVSEMRTIGGDLLARVLRRHSFPTRPCNSYTFYVMARWRAAQSSTFGETSKRLSDAWRRLPVHEKNEFMEMALKDNDRYRRQCMLLMSTKEEKT